MRAAMADRDEARTDPRARWPGQIPRPLKRRTGGAARKPAHVRTSGIGISAKDRAYIRRWLGMRLAKFSSSIERVTVRLEDVNGPRGGIDKVCKAKVVLTGLPSVVVERKHHDARAAVDGVIDASERAVRRVLHRRRSVPLRASRRPPRGGARVVKRSQRRSQPRRPSSRG